MFRLADRLGTRKVCSGGFLMLFYKSRVIMKPTVNNHRLSSFGKDLFGGERSWKKFQFLKKSKAKHIQGVVSCLENLQTAQKQFVHTLSWAEVKTAVTAYS